VIEWDRRRPRWVQVYEVIKGQILSGELAPGDRVPSVHDLMRDYGIANSTTQKVFRQLRADGLIITEPGMGSFVSEGQSGTARPTDQG
jgi:DNA-binding transcriptional regulator YhcF (GntR family)